MDRIDPATSATQYVRQTRKYARDANHSTIGDELCGSRQGSEKLNIMYQGRNVRLMQIK